MVGDEHEIVYVAGASPDQWAFWNGRVFHSTGDPQENARQTAKAAGVVLRSLAAPMPATVIKVLVAPGSHVAEGETVLLLEAMKMELPVRAPGAGTVKAVHCRAGDLVQAGQELVELE
jgi:3-methylcrotonyl-CoA carboxylase alpha subunit